MGRNLQDVLHLIICLVIMPTGVVEAACPNCEVCNGDTCTRCIAGYYIYSDNVCYRCSDKCTPCTGATHNRCFDCRDGYYTHPYCYPCSYNCTKCAITSYHCSACRDGYYLSGSTCNLCDTQCATCTGANSRQCSTCKDGYYLSGSTCYSCFTRCALPCTGANSNQCTECKDGYYLSGTTCNLCNTQCATCIGAGSNQCSACNVGYYLGENSRNGTCITGCEDGWFGDRCDIECPPGCAVCNQDDGKCTECNPGKHGVVCDHDCSHGCRSVNGSVTCARIGGTCTHECVPGHWNNTCDNLCNDGCLNSICDTSTGHCLDGCLREYFGNSCSDKQQASVIGPALGGGIGALCFIIVAATVFVLYRKGYRIKRPGKASKTYTATTYENDVEIAENPDADSSSNGHHEYESPMDHDMTEIGEDNDYDVLQLPESSASGDSQESSRMEDHMDMRPGSSVGSKGNGSGNSQTAPKHIYTNC